MELFNKPIVLMALAMFLALGIERLLEVVRAVSDHLEARQGGAKAVEWEAKAARIRNRIEVRLNNVHGGGAATLQLVLGIVSRYLGPAPAGAPGLFAVSVEQYRTMSIRLRYKIVAIVLGVALAFLFQLDIFALVDLELAREPGRSLKFNPYVGTAISGVAMGFGAGPVHKLITALEVARRKRL